MPPEDQEIRALLRLKKFEQPPPGYYESFLTEFQRRQREELLRRSFWQLALDRAQVFFSEHAMASRLSYASATVAVLALAGVASWRILVPLEPEMRMAEVPVSRTGGLTALVSDANTLDAAGARGRGDFPAADFAARPHYVIDARPVSYEPPFSF